MKTTKMGFFLDGKPVNTDKLLAAAGLEFADVKKASASAPRKLK